MLKDWIHLAYISKSVSDIVPGVQMVPNGHTATYVFFKSIIRLGLYNPQIGFIRAVDYFLYRWKSRRRNGNKSQNTPSKNNTKARTRKRKRIWESLSWVVPSENANIPMTTKTDKFNATFCFFRVTKELGLRFQPENKLDFWLLIVKLLKRYPWLCYSQRGH
jgi:hypothetical protein